MMQGPWLRSSILGHRAFLVRGSRRAGRPQRSEDRTGPASDRARPKAALDPRKETSHSAHTQHAHMTSRDVRAAGLNACCAVLSVSGTSAIGRYQTTGGTFSRLDALGEIDPMVEDGVDGQSRREAAGFAARCARGLDDSRADPTAGPRSVRLPANSPDLRWPT
jgi:hypothetical protein